MKHFNRISPKIVCILTASLLLASCAGGNSSGSTSASSNSSSQETTGASSTASGPEPLTLPVTTEDITVTWWADLDKAAGAVATLNDVLAYQKLQEITGVKIEFQHPPVGSAQEQFNLLVASRNLPDIITFGWANVPGGPASYINDQVIIPLNDPINQWAPNLLAYYKENPVVHQQQEMDDGTYYVFPAVYGDRELAVNQGPVIRSDMFDKLGLAETPTTIDEWTEMLRKVKETDFGSGVGAVSPLFLTLGNAGVPLLQNAPMILGSWGIRQEFYNDGGTVKYGAMQPEFKEFLTLMKSWYDEGLLDPESLTGVAKIQDEKMSENKLFAINGSMGNSITRYTAMMKPQNEAFKLIPLPYPVLNAGDPPGETQEAPSYNNGGAAITTACKHVKEVTKMLDYCYGEDGHILSNWGVEGTTYEKNADGTFKYTDLIMNNPDGLSREQAMAKYTFWQSNGAVAKYKDVLNQRDNLPEQVEGRANWMLSKNEHLLPPLTATSDESSELASIVNETRTYTNEMINQFISGKTSLDTFDKFVQTLKDMGIERAIELQQTQFERYQSRPALD